MLPDRHVNWHAAWAGDFLMRFGLQKQKDPETLVINTARKPRGPEAGSWFAEKRAAYLRWNRRPTPHKFSTLQNEIASLPRAESHEDWHGDS